MRIKVGTDIISISRFGEKFDDNRWKFERDIFFEDEVLEDSSPEHLAGIFAAKEAAIKAFGLEPGSWKLIKIKKLASGKPVLGLDNKLKASIKNCDVSISHSEDYAIAVVICIY